MKAHTNNYKENIKLYGRQITSKITFGNTILEDEELNSVTPVSQAALLKSAMKELDIDSNVNIPTGTILRYQFGLLVGNEYEYIDYGNYVVKSSEKQEDLNSYKIKCYDKLLYSMKNYDDVIPEVTYPITLKNYLSTIATSIGLTLKTGDFANQDKVITQELYRGLGYTVRDVFDQISEATGGVICLTLNDELEVRYPVETNDTIDEEYLNQNNINFAKKYGPINSIVLSRSAESDNVYLQDEDSIAENGLTEIKITDNQIMNFNNRSEYLQGILDKLNGLEFWINEYDSVGITYYDILDKYNVIIGDTTYPCLMLYDETDITQGLKELIHTDEPSQTQTDYTKADKTDRKINQTILIVDKQNQTITGIVETTENIKDNIENLGDNINNLDKELTDTTNQLLTLSTTVTQNNQQVTTEIQQILNNLDEGVQTVKNKLVTIDINGIHVATNISAIETLINNDSFKILSNDETLAFIGYDANLGKTVARMDNLTVTSYLVSGYHRQEKFNIDGEERTGWFFVGEVD